MAVAFDAVSNVAAGTGNLSWTHTPVGTPRGVKVDIVENGGTNGVSSVTYGGVAMELVAVNAKSSGEAGTVVTYFLGRSIPTGAQTVSVTVSDAVSKRAVAITVTAASDTCWVSTDFSIGSDSLANPSSTLNLLGKTCFVSLALHSGQGATTGITQLTGWTNRLEHDFGAQMGAWYNYNTISTADVACGWTQTADDAVMISLAITEAPVAVDSTAVRFTESASVAVVFDGRTMPINIIESASVAIITTLGVTDSLTVQASEGSSSIGLVISAADSTVVQVTETASVATLAAQQALPVHLTESASVTVVGVFTTDSTAVGASDTATLESSVPFFSVADSLTVTATDGRATVLTDTGALVVQTTDSLRVSATDAVTNLFVFIPGQTQNFVVSDSLRVALNGTGVAPTSKTASDSVQVVVEEPSTQDGAFTVIESPTLGLTESATVNTGSVTAFFTASDSVAVGTTESTALINNTILTVTDSTRVQAPEDIPEVATVLVSNDSLLVTISEPNDQSTQLGVADTVAVQGTGEVGQIGGLLTFTVTDSLACGTTESTSFGTALISASDSLRVVSSDVLTNSATVSATDSLRSGLSEAILAFKTLSAADDLAVRFTDTAAPIFNDFIAVSTVDTLTVQASESVSELVSYLNQLTVSDALAVQLTDDITTQTLTAAASDQLVAQLTESPALFQPSSVTDSLKIGTTEAGLAIPRVTVNSETFTDDTISGFQDDAALQAQNPSAEGVAVALLESVSAVKSFHGTDSLACRLTERGVLFVSQTVTDSAAPVSDDLITVSAAYQAADSYSVGANEQTNGYTVVQNATPNTWDGNTATEHRNDKPKPWKYILTEKLNW